MDKVKLTFMVPGFSKCGTTTLCSLLNEHPSIYIPAIKEPNFFIRPDFSKHWDEYNANFASLVTETEVGEGSTAYSAHEHEAGARERILALYPEIKFIFIARNPIKRIESSYREFHHSGLNYATNTPYGLGNAMRELPAIIEDTKYWARISNYRDYVDDGRILVVFLEDLVADHVAVLKRCFAFLGVSEAPAERILLSKHNAGEEKLYDTKLLRWLRLRPETGFKIAKLAPQQQNFYFYWLGLRRKFKSAIQWDDEALGRVTHEISADALHFLKQYGKPADFWKGLTVAWPEK